MDSAGNCYSNDDEYDFISSKTGYSTNIVELILWQRYCYEMENDFWEYPEAECGKCGREALYLKEVENIDFADQIICKNCGEQFIK